MALSDPLYFDKKTNGTDKIDLNLFIEAWYKYLQDISGCKKIIVFFEGQQKDGIKLFRFWSKEKAKLYYFDVVQSYSIYMVLEYSFRKML